MSRLEAAEQAAADRTAEATTSHEYLFDVKLFTAIRIKASTEEEARKKLAAYFDCASVNFGADEDGDPITGEASMDGDADLVEVDGEME